MKKRKISLFDVILYLVFGLIALITIYPFYNVLIVSLANTLASATYSPYLYPHVFDLTGYKTIMSDTYFYRSLGTTLFVTIVGTTLNMVFSVTAAYVLSRKRLIGRKFFLSAILFTMLFSGGLIPTYLVVSGLGLDNSIWSMIFPSMIMVTFLLFYAVERWNEWWNAYLYISDKNIKPLQIYLRDVLVNFNSQLATQAQSMMSSHNKVFVQSIQMATIIITMLPILCVYPFVQKYFVKGVLVGSVKE